MASVAFKECTEYFFLFNAHPSLVDHVQDDAQFALVRAIGDESNSTYLYKPFIHLERRAYTSVSVQTLSAQPTIFPRYLT